MKFGLFDHVEARRTSAGDPVRRAAHLRAGRRRCRHLLPACGRASRHAAQYGAGAGSLSRRGGARDQAHAPRSAGLSPPALFAAAPDRGDLHSRPSQPRANGGGRRPGRVSVRAQVPQDRARRFARHLHRCVQLRQRRPDHRHAQLCRQALSIRERPDRVAAVTAAAPRILVRFLQYHRLDLGGRARHAFREPRAYPLRQDQHRRLQAGAGETRRPGAAQSRVPRRHRDRRAAPHLRRRYRRGGEALRQAGDGTASRAAQLVAQHAWSDRSDFAAQCAARRHVRGLRRRRIGDFRQRRSGYGRRSSSR